MAPKHHRPAAGSRPGLAKAARDADTVLQSSQIEAFATQYRTLVQAGQAQNMPEPKKPGQRGRARQSSAFNLLRRLFEREHEVLRYMRDLCVPFTNNLAERAIRMALGLAEDFGLLSYLCGC